MPHGLFEMEATYTTAVLVSRISGDKKTPWQAPAPV